MDGCVDPQTLGALDEAARPYKPRLPPVIGRPAAQRHATSVAAYQRATEVVAAVEQAMARDNEPNKTQGV